MSQGGKVVYDYTVPLDEKTNVKLSFSVYSYTPVIKVRVEEKEREFETEQ
jgi:hypothetical protein|tara:strand:- start:105 stop:254 length:150 start_codon:yes stop_codon:yes gene_type:complete